MWDSQCYDCKLDVEGRVTDSAMLGFGLRLSGFGPAPAVVVK
jgi:hypothetical protein